MESKRKWYKNKKNHLGLDFVIYYVYLCILKLNNLLTKTKNNKMTATIKRVPKETKLARIIGKNLPDDVLTYLRKNPKQVYTNFRRGTSIFGRRTPDVSPVTVKRVLKDRKTIRKEWESLYTPTQLRTFSLYN